MNVNFDLSFSAKPANPLVVTLSSSSFNLQIQPSSVTLTTVNTEAAVQLTATAPGTFVITIGFSSGNGIISQIEDFNHNLPLNLLVTATDSSSTSTYFADRGLTPGTLEPGCCPAPQRLVCPDRPVALVSTCDWTSSVNDWISGGLVFASSDSLRIPIALDGVTVRIDSLSVSRPPDGTTCGNCSSCTMSTCACYQTLFQDIIAFQNTEALSTTFLQEISTLLPSWMSITTDTSDRTHSFSSIYTTLSDTLSIDDCNHFPLETLNANTNRYVVLKMMGMLMLDIQSDSVLLSGREEPICVAIDLCLGDASPVYISLRDQMLGSIEPFSQFASSGWIINPTGFVLSEGGIPESAFYGEGDDFQFAINGELDLTGDLGIINLNLVARGIAIVHADYNSVSLMHAMNIITYNSYVYTYVLGTDGQSLIVYKTDSLQLL